MRSGGPEGCALRAAGVGWPCICDAVFAALDPHRSQARLSFTTSAAEEPASIQEKTNLARSMRIELLNRFSSICLAALLQFTPLARVFLSHSNAPLSAWVLTIRWILLGSVTSAVATVTVLSSQEIVLAVGSVSAVGGSLTFQVTGPPLADYIISVSPDLVQWTPVLTNSVTQGLLRFQEALESTRSARFYRASLAN